MSDSIWNKFTIWIEMSFLMQCVFLAWDKNGSQFPVPLKPDKKKGALSKKTAWFLGTVRSKYRVCKRIQDNARPSCHTIIVTKLNINKYISNDQRDLFKIQAIYVGS